MLHRSLDVGRDRRGWGEQSCLGTGSGLRQFPILICIGHEDLLVGAESESGILNALECSFPYQCNSIGYND